MGTSADLMRVLPPSVQVEAGTIPNARESLPSPAQLTWGTNMKPCHGIGIKSAWGGCHAEAQHENVVAVRIRTKIAHHRHPEAVQYVQMCKKKVLYLFKPAPIYHITPMWFVLYVLLSLSLGVDISAKPPTLISRTGHFGWFCYQLRRHENRSGVIGLIWSRDGGW